MNLVDRILYNGNIYTLNDTQPKISALAISRGRIVAVGDDDAMLSLAGADTARENLEGRTVIPGLTDAHMHWEWTTAALQEVPLFEVPSAEEAVRRVAEFAQRKAPGEWITGFGWLQDIWEGRAFPNAAMLDAVTPNHPVSLRGKSSHVGWVNSLALKEADITATTPDPEGGQIQRDASGEPTGILFETAMELVHKKIPPKTSDQLADDMVYAQEKALASGLTGFHDFDQPTSFRAVQRLRERGQLGMRVLKQVNKEWLPHLLALGVRRSFGDEWIRIGNLKIFADGALGPRTAYMIEPYENEPDNYGIVVTDKEEMKELASEASAAGIATAIHAIGDRAVHDVLDVFEAVRQEEAARGEPSYTRRHRIEHIQIIHPDDAPRVRQLDLIASMQPIHATSDYQLVDRYWGERGAWAYNFRYQLEAGAVMAFGSDSPIDTFDPLVGIHAAVTRRRADGSPGVDGWYPDGRLSIMDTLRGFTQGPAYAAHMENDLGQLMPGFLADLVMLDNDIITCPPDEILSTTVVATMVGGTWRFGGVS